LRYENSYERHMILEDVKESASRVGRELTVTRRTEKEPIRMWMRSQRTDGDTKKHAAS
jgi:hypothetical protein